jgi:hypothetical protein
MKGEAIVICPLCGRKQGSPIKSWTYGIFRVDAYKCMCGGRFNEYSSILITLDDDSKSKTSRMEKRSFQLLMKNGKWAKV